jgi:hypothetical protein
MPDCGWQTGFLWLTLAAYANSETSFADCSLPDFGLRHGGIGTIPVHFGAGDEFTFPQ